MLCVVSEDTERVIGERRMATLRELGSDPTAIRSEAEALALAGRHLAANLHSLPFTLTYLFDDDGGDAHLRGSSGIAPGHPAAPEVIRRDDPAPRGRSPTWSRARRQLLPLAGRFGELPTGAWREPPVERDARRAAPSRASRRRSASSSPGSTAMRPLDESYRDFVELVAGQIATTRRQRARLRGRARARGAARRARPREDDLLHQRQPRAAHAADAAARPGRGRAHRRRRAALARAARARRGRRTATPSGCSSSSTRCSTSPASRPSQAAPAASSRSTSPATRPSWPRMFDSAVERAGLTLHGRLPAAARAGLRRPRDVGQDRAQPGLQRPEVHVRGRDHRAAPAEGDGRSRLTVADTGIGIAPADQPQLFERFHRVAGARSRTHEGSGIGLALVAELAALHGGAVDGRERARGAGARFAVRAPARRAPARRRGRRRTDDARRALRGELRRGGAALARQPRRAAETDRPRRRAARACWSSTTTPTCAPTSSALLSDEYRVETAPRRRRGARARRARRPPDLVLTDVMMPHLDGFGLLRALRERRRCRATCPVIMLSARAGEEGTVEGLEAGADDYLVKPFSARELLARVRANLELERVRRTRDQLQPQPRRCSTRRSGWPASAAGRSTCATGEVAGFGGVRAPAAG